MTKEELEKFDDAIVSTYETIQSAKAAGLDIYQIVRMVEALYHVGIARKNIIPVPEVFVKIDEMFEQEMAKAKRLQEEAEVLLTNAAVRKAGYDPDDETVRKIMNEPIEDYLNSFPSEPSDQMSPIEKKLYNE